MILGFSLPPTGLGIATFELTATVMYLGIHLASRALSFQPAGFPTAARRSGSQSGSCYIPVLGDALFRSCKNGFMQDGGYCCGHGGRESLSSCMYVIVLCGEKLKDYMSNPNP